MAARRRLGCTESGGVVGWRVTCGRTRGGVDSRDQRKQRITFLWAGIVQSDCGVAVEVEVVEPIEVPRATALGCEYMYMRWLRNDTIQKNEPEPLHSLPTVSISLPPVGSGRSIVHSSPTLCLPVLRHAVDLIPALPHTDLVLFTTSQHVSRSHHKAMSGTVPWMQHSLTGYENVDDQAASVALKDESWHFESHLEV